MMISSRRLLIPGLVTACSAIALVGFGAGQPDAITRIAQTAPGSQPESEKLQFLGVQSCAASNCHGGNTRRGRNVKGAEYSIWILSDPHAHALSTLYNRESQQIYHQLKKSPAYRNLLPPHMAPLCLNCHCSPATSAGNRATIYENGNAARSVQAETRTAFRDGVGCEACHGASEKWLEPHKRPDWNLTDEQKNNPDAVLADLKKKAELGFQNTHDIFTRARLCAECHVGSPGRQVNHDLIAAGHPRLTFEMSDYLSRMPRHWSHADEENREFLIWAAGQLTTAVTSLELLEHRAGNNGIWPELAESDCFACHHNLQSPSFRQERSPTGKVPGQLRWGSWNTAMLPLLADYTKHPEKEHLLDSRESLKNVMSRPFPPPREAAGIARSLRTNDLAEWNATLKTFDGGERTATDLLRRICEKDGSELVEDGWDSAAQVYYSLKALHRDERRRGKTTPASSQTIEDALERFRRLLEIPEQDEIPDQRNQTGKSGAAGQQSLSAEERIAEMKKLLKIILAEYSGTK